MGHTQLTFNGPENVGKTFRVKVEVRVQLVKILGYAHAGLSKEVKKAEKILFVNLCWP